MSPARIQKHQAIGTVRGRRDYEALSESDREARHLAFDAIGLMRSRDLSLSAAAAEAGTTSAIVRRFASDLLVKEGSRYRATPSDRAYQRMSVLSVDGVADIDTRGSRVRSTIGRHWNAVRQFAIKGDVSLLAPFEGVRVGGVELAADPDIVEEYLRQGGLDIDDIYV